ncbi:PREDICTED: maltase 1-like [Ceratosolen solmsi marchali]|uniref:alpha-glucosidase n=1 Tax=Ceratosolen solmsi marchali TaxID=326594 RepID=A0AAJ6YFQ6_9HYME|nr:PREDICTED: maltase 1-like [Ceratosolen solmsi marchali]
MLSWRSYLTFLLIITIAAGEIINRGWWKNEILYQTYVRSFMDLNNDGIGDIKGVTSKLRHFLESGITAILLSPINTSPMIDTGYDITNFLDIDKSYGTLTDFEELTKKANKNGIKVIMDFVPNHTSDQHEWFVKSVNSDKKYKDYYVWRKGQDNNSKPPNNWISVFGGSAWTYNKKRDLWYLHQFDYRQPDLNFTNPNVHREMEEIMKFWLQKGVSGFRIDAPGFIYENDNFLDEPLSNYPGAKPGEYRYLNHIYTMNDERYHNLLMNWRNIMDKWSDARNDEEKIMLVEVYTSLQKVMALYDFGANIPFNFYFVKNLDSTSKPSDFKKVIDDWMAALPEGVVANWVTSNHDNKRSTSKFPERPDLMLSLVMILPGVACIYYGEEIAMVDNYDITWEQIYDPRARKLNAQSFSTSARDFFRAPYQWDDSINAGFSKARKTWLPVHKNYKILNLKNQKFEPESHFKLFKTLVALKKSSETLKSGSLITDTLNNDKVLVVSRQSSNESIVFIVNFSDDVSQNVNLNKYLPGAVRATVIISSVGSNIRWGANISVMDVVLPPKIILVITSTIHRRN